MLANKLTVTLLKTNQKTNPYFRPTFVIHVPGISVSFKRMLLTTHVVLLYTVINVAYMLLNLRCGIFSRNKEHIF